jgi:hypothetical protein
MPPIFPAMGITISEIASVYGCTFMLIRTGRQALPFSSRCAAIGTTHVPTSSVVAATTR